MFSEQELSAAANKYDFRLHNGALEWSLADPIVIESADDVKSKVNWQDRLEPFHHQMQNLMTFCRRLPVTLLADDVGLGKTISAGLILAELMTRRRVSRTLVLCPSILGPQWIEELDTKFNIVGDWATGKELDRKLRSNSPVIVTTYESARSRIDKIAPGTFDMIILDEAHKLRNLYGTNSPPLLAKRLHKCLQERLFKFVLMLTATPIQNRLWDLYTLIDCLSVAKGHANPLGSPSSFRREYIADRSGPARELIYEKREDFRRVLRQYMVRTRREDVRLIFPEREVRLFRIPPSELDRELQTIVAQNIEGLNGFQQSSLARAMMSSPAALASQLENMSRSDQRWTGLAAQVRSLSNGQSRPSKLDGLMQTVDYLRQDRPDDWRLVVFTIRKETLKSICALLRIAGIAFGVIQGGSPQKNHKTVKAFSADPPGINVIVSTDAGAEGINLQAGNVVLNYDLPWNPMVVEQRIGRVQRLASKHKSVVVINLAVAGSPEEKVVAKLMAKLQTVASTVGDIEAILEATSRGRDEVESFEATVRDMVIKSLAGQDVRRATEMAENSIQKAKDLFESQRKEIDTSLGRLDELHHSGPQMPRLRSVKPGMSVSDFVLRALESDGNQIINNEECEFIVRPPRGAEERGTFDESFWNQYHDAGIFHGRRPKLYQPGKPAFERLVQKWLDRAEHHVMNTEASAEAILRQLVSEWLSQIEGSSMISLEVDERTPAFQGASCTKVTASNGLDSYEKLVWTGHVPADHLAVSDEVQALARSEVGTVTPSDLVNELPKAIELAVVNDSDVSSFCGFYRDRLENEISKAGNRDDLRKRVIDDLSTTVHGNVVSLEGILYEVCRFTVTFSIDGEGEYLVQLEGIPATRQLIAEPKWATCGHTGRRVPNDCLGQCGISRQTVLQHLLVKSDVSGRVALKENTCRCDITGMVALNDEFSHSEISGRRVITAYLESSPMSGRKALPEEFVECEFTGALVLPDEIETSDISEKRFRADECETSAISGKRGHESEFIRCHVTGDFLLPEETNTSDVSGVRVGIGLLVESDKEPHRKGTAAETVRCEVTGRLLLTDEVDICEVSKKTVDIDLLFASEESGRLVSEEYTAVCDFTKKRVAVDEIVTSAVSGRRIVISAARQSPISERYALPAEMASCEITGAMVLPDELVKSDVSGRMFRSDQAVQSDASGRTGHYDETCLCEYTNSRLLRDESGHSDLTGKVAAAANLEPSEKSGRNGTAEEMGVCSATRKRLLSDELAKSGISGLLFDRDLLVQSGVSSKKGHPDEFLKCELTGKRLAPDEAGVCTVTKKMVYNRLLSISEVTGNSALAEHFTVCAASGKRALPRELARCAITNTSVVPHLLVQCAATGKDIRRDHAITSSLSGRYMTPSRAFKSTRDSRVCCPDEVKFCYWSESHFFPDQVGKCKRTGLTFAHELLNARSEFTLLSDLLSGRLKISDASDLLPMFRNNENELLQKTRRCWGVYSKSTKTRAICAEIHEWFGVRVRYAGVLVRGRGAKAVILGQVTVNAKNQLGWEPLE